MGSDFMAISVVLLAAGSGTRTGLKYNKVLYEIKGKKIIEYSIYRFRKTAIFSEIVLVVSQEEYEYFSKKYKNIVDKVIVGGQTRQESVYNSLKAVVNDTVLIHDGARPFIPDGSIKRIIEVSTKEKSITLGVKVKDTIQEFEGNRVVKTLNRTKLIATQTPQCFDRNLLLEAHEKAIKDQFVGTDDTVLIEKYFNIGAYIVEGDYRNIKLTTLDDVKLLEVIL
jgi:2-C-methyl-D-erythritol 4-phosphate cytidylyltransferase